MKHDIAQQRLKTIEGHIRGIQKMIDQEAYCIDVIRQINAVQSALNKVSTIILDEHLHSCLITAVRSENPDDREKVLKEITEVFQAKTES
ncbi:MAG: transcriptional regulator [Chloroflexi bacterium RBG_16_54_18]|nr:MAG: transcriptional regulator [Chloroflexi bacterium RBG_16_54_18]